MSAYLSTAPVFFTPTPEIRALDGKSILIADEGGGETPAKVRVADADPNGPDAGKCSVDAWQASMDDVEWVDAGSGQPPPTTQTHMWRRFLTPDALKSIRANQADPAYELLLELPTEEA
jgi:hypothetical protein